MDKAPALSAKERLFCCLYMRLGDDVAAAKQAGFPAPEQAAMRLLGNAHVREEIQRLRGELRHQMEAEALAGLRRLALGTRNDAAYLACAREPCREELDGLDLFGVAEIKQAKDGGCDIKFIDRLPALTLLLEYGRASQGNQPGSLFDALEQSAHALAAGGVQNDL